MGRKLFLSHLAETDPLASDYIQDVRSLDEGIVNFTYIYPMNPLHKINLQACATDLSEYPDGNSFMLCTDDDSLQPAIPRALQRLSESAHGKHLCHLLSEVSDALTIAISMGDSLEDAAKEPAQEDDDFDFDFEEETDHHFFGAPKCEADGSASEVILDSDWPIDIKTHTIGKIRADLSALKKSGFRVGVFGALTSCGILSVSVRTSKLGLSDEALEAWGIPRKRYLVLLIRYFRGYRDATKVADAADLNNSVQMKVGLCAHYKPALSEVLRVFQSKSQEVANPPDQVKVSDKDGHLFEPLFIGKALNQFLEERFFWIIQMRHLHGLSWLGAESFISDWQASVSTSTSGFGALEAYAGDDAPNDRDLTPMVLADHLGHVPITEASLPLIMMQFVVRHVVRCTEFCLVCHCRVDESFEALKPYVCLKPLCLFQYLALGFGPSLEWEVLTQPYVVDLLVSFCYAAAAAGRLKELPVGMNLTVPDVRLQPSAKGIVKHATRPQKSFSCTWDRSKNLLTVNDSEEEMELGAFDMGGGDSGDPNIDPTGDAAKVVKAGDWLLLVFKNNETTAHCKVTRVDLPQISVHQPIIVSPGSEVNDVGSLRKGENNGTSCIQADCYLHDKSFDDLAKEDQQRAVSTLLDALPSVLEMQKYLDFHGRGEDASLKMWLHRIPESALNLLRWIVASNRSCIVQVDEINDKHESPFPGRPEERVGGMDGWIQFRFAQGAPDKEKRFLDCVTKQSQATNNSHPTLFAWHGSQIGNWHSIIRQGLRYDEVVHGRAFGNGIYMSNHAGTSMGYSAFYAHGRTWKSSALKVSQVLSLQEVVNRPDKFVSSNPHYVVSDIDWVQTRYLFIKRKEETKPQTIDFAIYKQDPARLVFNEQHQAISIPLTAISKTRHRGKAVHTLADTQTKRPKMTHETDQATAEGLGDDGESVVSDEEDLAILKEPADRDLLDLDDSDPNARSLTIHGNKKRPAETTLETDFVAGTLDLTGITFMSEPQDATTIATKALMRLLREALKTQESTAPAELGWYINRNLVNNMYQWIVELHSFPEDLPLARDLKAAGLTSIVMEMRFTSQYPFSPPFIRVVKPRFLSFQRGGGGNVTDGGSMCMEVLTNNGWSAGLTVESLLLQVRLVISDTERAARLASQSQHHGSNVYGVGEAMAAYIRACKAHGWTVPTGFSTIQH